MKTGIKILSATLLLTTLLIIFSFALKAHNIKRNFNKTSVVLADSSESSSNIHVRKISIVESHKDIPYVYNFFTKYYTNFPASTDKFSADYTYTNRFIEPYDWNICVTVKDRNRLTIPYTMVEYHISDPVAFYSNYGDFNEEKFNRKDLYKLTNNIMNTIFSGVDLDQYSYVTNKKMCDELLKQLNCLLVYSGVTIDKCSIIGL